MNTKKQHEIVDKILYVFISLFFLYAFWYQYTVSVVGGALIGLGIIIFFLSFLNIRISLKFYGQLISIVVFWIFVSTIGVIASPVPRVAISHCIDILKYMIPMIGIYTYVNTDIIKLIYVLRMILFTTFLVALSAIFNGNLTNTGAIIPGTMNANVESSLLMMGAISALIIWGYGSTKIFEKIAIIIILIVCAMAQLLCASRRGLVVFVFIVCSGIYIIIKNKYNNKLYKYCLYIIGILCACCFVYFIYDFVVESVFLERLMNTNNEGDRVRNVLQAQAGKLFLESPIWGKGLGYVSYLMGLYSHSLYYELLACTGIIGTSLILTFLIKRFFVFWKVGTKKYENEVNMLTVSKIMSIFILVILLSGLYVVYIYDAYFYVILGLICSYSRIISYKGYNKRRKL